MSQNREKHITLIGPVTKAVGLVKGKDGWRAVYLETQGGEITKEEFLGTESAKYVAIEELKVAVIHKLMGD